MEEKREVEKKMHQEYERATFLYEAGNYLRSREIFDMLIALDPENALYWFGRSSCLQMQKAYLEATESWENTLRVQERSGFHEEKRGECYLHLAESFFSLKQTTQALRALSQASCRITSPTLCKTVRLLKERWTTQTLETF